MKSVFSNKTINRVIAGFLALILLFSFVPYEVLGLKSYAEEESLTEVIPTESAILNEQTATEDALPSDNQQNTEEALPTDESQLNEYSMQDAGELNFLMSRAGEVDLGENEVYILDKNGDDPNKSLFVYNYETQTITKYVGGRDGGVIFSRVSYTDPVTGATVDNAPVLHIGDGAFAYDVQGSITMQIKNVTIEEGIQTIGAGAFSGNALTTISIPSSVTEIKANAFFNNNLSELDLSRATGLTKIGADAFRNNSLTSVTISDNVTEIGDRAFMLNSLTSLTLNDTGKLTRIGSSAFYGNALTEVAVPSSVTDYGSSVFAGNDRYVITTGDNTNLKTYSEAGNFGEIHNPVTIIIKTVDGDGNLIGDGEYKRTTPVINQAASTAELIAIGNFIDIAAPSIQGYTASTKVVGEVKQDKQEFTIEYYKSDLKPTIEGLYPINVELGGAVDLMAGVVAKDGNGNELSSDAIKYTIRDSLGREVTKIDSTVIGEYDVTYTVTHSGNSITETRKVNVGIGPGDVQTGNGWTYGDFTYSSYNPAMVTGLSASGLEKLKTNTDIVLPSYNPKDPTITITEIGGSAFYNKGLTSVEIPKNCKKNRKFRILI